MKKILTLLLVFASGVCLAEKCTYCPATMGVRIVNGSPYCSKHYCSKHKEIHSESKCYRCDLESRLSRGKAKCVFCNNTKKLKIAKGNRKFDTFCPDHFCASHKCAFYEPYSGTPYCRKCKQDDSKQFRSEPLTGLFGVELSASIDSIKATMVEPGTYKFTPDKQFRDFKNYAVFVSDGKIHTIWSFRTFSEEEDAENEFETVLSLLDKKYSRERRTGILKKGYYDWVVIYGFDYDEHHKNEKQRIVIKKGRSSAGKYDVIIFATNVSESKKLFETEEKNDIDAL